MTPVEPIVDPNLTEIERTPPDFSTNSSPTESYTSMKEWLGEDGYKKFMDLMFNNLRNEISKIEKKSKKAARNLKNAIEGNPQDP